MTRQTANSAKACRLGLRVNCKCNKPAAPATSAARARMRIRLDVVTESSVHRAVKENAHAEHRCQLNKPQAAVGIDGCGFDGHDFHISCRIDTGRVQLGHPFPPRWIDFEPSCRVTVRISGCRDPIAESIHHPVWGDSCPIPKRNLGHLQLSYISTPRRTFGIIIRIEPRP